eukprot:CAMPEP_0197428304 /NCGR_PEP_ID=MMETSP1170-20131217/40705_1 /TAXON_ID=54406 /ORGANISM="Sarcinochrysis sp, Strain CCMP770" /LENGTH=146 /DNA_ID=CAMNT_0042956047 /DNA_START=19 /DNA_END=459 /DNA_ORIENTATION=+
MAMEEAARSARGRRLELVIEKMLSRFQERVATELDATSLFEEYVDGGYPVDLDMAKLGRQIAGEIRHHFHGVCESLNLFGQLADLESVSSPHCDDVRTDDAPEDIIRHHRRRRKLDLKAQLEAQLQELQADNQRLATSVQTTLDTC